MAEGMRSRILNFPERRSAPDVPTNILGVSDLRDEYMEMAAQAVADAAITPQLRLDVHADEDMSTIPQRWSEDKIDMLWNQARERVIAALSEEQRRYALLCSADREDILRLARTRFMQGLSRAGWQESRERIIRQRQRSA